MRESLRGLLCVAVAVAVHGALAHCFFPSGQALRARTAPDSVDIELAGSMIARAPEKPETGAASVATSRPFHALRPSVPHAPRGAIATRAPETVPSKDLPAATSNGKSGDSSEQLPEPSSFTAPNATSTSAPTRPRRPRLIPVADVCRGVFPEHTDANAGTVTVALRVSDSGRPASLRIVDERPTAQGFAGSARLCVPRLRFEPAADSAGLPIAANSIVRLRFVRGL